MIPFRLRLISFFLRFYFKLLYHQMAWTYDWVAATVSVGQWNSWVRSVLPYVQGRRVLELGHGPGHLQLALRTSKGELSLSQPAGEAPERQVFGLDRSPQMGRLALRRLLRSGWAPGLVNGLAQALPFPSGTFDTVLSTFPSEYIFDPQTLLEIWRVLAPGGKFVVLPLAWITGRRPLERLAALLFRVTGEAPPFDEQSLQHSLEPLRRIGFEVRAEFLALPASKLFLVEASKPLFASKPIITAQA